MKIAFYSHLILEVGGGLEKYFIETSLSLVRLYPDLEIDIITNHDDFAISLRPAMSLFFMKKMTKQDLYRESEDSIRSKLGMKVKYIKPHSFSEIRTVLNKYDFIYSKNEIIESFILKFILRYRRIPPVVFGCHTPIYYPVTDTIQSKLHNFLYLGLAYRFLASGAYKFHVLNNADARCLKHSFPKKEVVSIPNPFDFDRFLKLGSGKIAQGKSGKLNILWVGRLTDQKGVVQLKRIIESVNRNTYAKHIVWTIAGDGPELNIIEKLNESFDNVNYLGHVANEKISSVYAKNDLYISTSKWEGFPYNLLEAQSYGIPVLCNNIDGCTDIISHSINGYLCKDDQDFEQKIKQLLLDYSFDNKKIANLIRSKFDEAGIYKKLRGLFV